MFITKFGVQVNQCSGWSPLHAAVRKGHTETVKMLMKYGAKPDCLYRHYGIWKETPLSLARLRGHKDTVEAMLAHKRAISND